MPFIKRMLPGLVWVVAGAILGIAWSESRSQFARGDGSKVVAKLAAKPDNRSPVPSVGNYLKQSEGYSADRPENDYGLGDCHVSKLLPYPAL